VNCRALRSVECQSRGSIEVDAISATVEPVAGSGFTSRYHFDRVVYFETYDLVVEAIAREKAIKAMARAKKIALVKSLNPTWTDLLPPMS
jgi:predicted GIY-YIG superfamily endonuclease